jgi:hypothetical protein
VPSSRIGKAPLERITVVPPFRNMVRRFDPFPSIRAANVEETRRFRHPTQLRNVVAIAQIRITPSRSPWVNNYARPIRRLDFSAMFQYHPWLRYDRRPSATTVVLSWWECVGLLQWGKAFSQWKSVRISSILSALLVRFAIKYVVAPHSCIFIYLIFNIYTTHLEA